MGGVCSAYGERRGAYRALVEKLDGKKQRGRPRHNWEDILRWIFREWDVALWTESIWLRIGTVGWLL